MKTILLCAASWMALSTTAWGQARPAQVVFTYRDRLPQEGFRLGDECFVPIETLNAFGWTAFLRDGQAEVKVAGKVHKAPIRSLGGRRMVPLRRIVSLLGAGSEWRDGADTLAVFSLLKSVSISDSAFSGVLSLPVDPLPSVEQDPDRLVLELRGARLDPRLKLPPGTKAEQFRPESVRLTIALNGSVDIDAKSLRPTDVVKFDYRRTTGTGPVVLKPKGAPVQPLPVEHVEVGAPDPAEVTPEQGVLATGPLPIIKESETTAVTMLQIPLRGLIHGPATFDRPSPDVLEIFLPQVQMDDPQLESPLADAVLGVAVRQENGGTFVRITLSRAMGAEVTSDETGVRIKLARPVGSGSMAGKIIVVDAGHGGKDRGSNRNGIYEKDLTLRIARQLSAALTAAGATVIMTRNSDVFVTLPGRAAIAERNRADLFLSCHINSTAGNNNQSGTITFHHFGRPKSQALASEIHRELAPATRIPSLGVWSDKRIYRTGFAVLRQSTMPGVLIEFGFINHNVDRTRMLQPDFARQSAEAIVRGVRNYFLNGS